jgi:hypothetical protein
VYEYSVLYKYENSIQEKKDKKNVKCYEYSVLYVRTSTRYKYSVQ